MERLPNYYADASIHKGKDTYGVNEDIYTDSFQMFDNCNRSIFEVYGDTMLPKEFIGLYTTLINFSLLCKPIWMYHISWCLDVCAVSLQEEDTHGDIAATRRDIDPINRQAPMWTIADTRIPLDEDAIENIEKLLSTPLDSLVLKVLDLEH